MDITQFNNTLDQALAAAPGVIAELEVERNRIDEEIRRIKQFQKAMGVSEAPKPKGKAKRSVKQSRPVRFTESDQIVVNAVAAIQHEQFAVSDVREILPNVHEGQVYKTFRKLRAVEVLGKMGSRKRGSHSKEQLWRVMNRDHLMEAMQ